MQLNGVTFEFTNFTHRCGYNMQLLFCRDHIVSKRHVNGTKKKKKNSWDTLDHNPTFSKQNGRISATENWNFRIAYQYVAR